MSLTDQLTDYVNAAFTGLWIQSYELDEAERDLIRLSQQQRWTLALWDIASGLRLANGSASSSLQDVAAGDPLSAVRALAALANPSGTTLLALHHFHRFLNSPEVVQTVIRYLLAGKQQRTFLVVLSPVVQIPIELEKLFVVLEHALPDREQLLRIARELTSDQPQDLPQGEDLQRVLDAAAGLTRYEAEAAFALSLARQGVIRPEAIWELKAQALCKQQLLTLHRGEESFAQLGGLQALKDFCRRALAPGRSVKPRGLLLLGVPGSGKSMFAKALGHETGRPTLTLDLGALYGGIVGQTENNIRQALRLIDAMAPCVCFLDELEKALAGVGSQGDSGVSSRLFGTLLTWLADHDSDVFFIATANNLQRLPPELARAERFDAIFFIDLPDRQEKEAIWQMYRRYFGIPANQGCPDDGSWTGAEIRSCCRLAALLDIPLTQAAQQVVPVAATAAEAIEQLRTWASGRCLNAAAPGIYRREATEPRQPGRRVQRGPSNN